MKEFEKKHWLSGRLDPREIIYQCDELHEPLQYALRDHIEPSGDWRDDKAAKPNNQFKIDGRKDRNEGTALVFKDFADRYIKELNKDPDKLADFRQKEEHYGKAIRDRQPLLKDVLPFVQSARLILMLEETKQGQGIDNLVSLFYQIEGSQDRFQFPHRLLDHEIEDYLKVFNVSRSASEQNKQLVFLWCQALFHEYRQQYREALKSWKIIIDGWDKDNFNRKLSA